MQMHEESLERLKRFFAQFDREMTPNNQKQAMMPEGCAVFPNNYGTAPGLAVESGGKTVIMLPGPPRELEPMFTEEVKPFLLNLLNSNKQDNLISQVEHILGGYMQSLTNPTVAPYAKTGEVELRVTASGKNQKSCEALIAPVIEKIKSGIGGFIYGIDAGSLQNAVVKKLLEKNLTLATAESCTGGLIGKRITEIAGCSRVYPGGVISYDNSVKVSQLNVSGETLKNHGAVSEQAALEMCKGAALNLGADIGVSSTGIAGPGGGTKTKPVGLVYIGIYCESKKIHKAIELNLSRRMYKDEREMIRHAASSHALREILRLF
jgi:nicotinamide-nucleotide amidase